MMSEQAYQYVIVGGGLAGASAVKGIRERDESGSILLVGSEEHLPYDRPPLTKQLWYGKKTVDKIRLHDEQFYRDRGVQLALGVEIVELDPEQRTIADVQGRRYRYQKLLLATGGHPRTLGIPGSEPDNICYYRYLDDYLKISKEASDGRSALVIGGGFIGSEIAAALSAKKVKVTMIFPGPYLVDRVFPEGLGSTLQEQYRARGITIQTSQSPVSIERRGRRFVTRTRSGSDVESDLVIAGVGIAPSVRLAQVASLTIDNGIAVSEHLQTSNPDIYAAGDNASFPYEALGRRVRIEHWDNALSQGKHAGANMAGGREPFTYMPYFFSDLFEFGYEAVGDVSSSLDTFADWRKENDTGVIYYLRDGVVVGVMMCNVWEKVDDARALIRQRKRMATEDLQGAIA
jgi:3-phenylpropionate/trans-cinnamate dioxygenase ferredoxin reductase subunit